MKKAYYLLLTISLMAIGKSLFAQKVASSEGDKIRFGVEAGATLANMGVKARTSSSTKITSKMKALCFLTAQSDIPINNLLSLQPGLSFAGKGGKVNFLTATTGVSTSEDRDYSLWYLEVPIKLAAKIPAGPGRAIIGAGPYLSLGLLGRYKDKAVMTPGDTYTDEENIKFSNTLNLDANEDADLYTFKPMDVGAILSLGYDYKDIYVNLAGSFGFTDIAHKAAYESFKNRTYSLSIGYFFY